MTMNEENKELPKAYNAKAVDQKWYEFWETNHFFRADPASKKPSYCIVMPPPNVTGVLHMGHALSCTLEDTLIRWKRMCGFETLYLPGTDHAGIATQTVVERNLIKTTGKRRKDFSREEFVKHIWEWKETSQHRILNQVRKIGCSCDWSRLRFTMDEGNNRAVRTMFKKLFDQQLIYRGDYLVNWDPITQTALSDEEVEYEERLSSLWYFKYPLKDSSGFIVIATTRPETMLGDTAVAVSPKDPRYSHLIGKTVVLPLSNREIPIIADHTIDPEFGTGAVKITPAHDHNDYLIGNNHHLPRINIMTTDGKVNENGGVFAGLSFEAARKAVVTAMTDLGLVDKIEPHVNRIGVSYRSKAVIEPFLSKQWFIKMSHFVEKMRAVVENKKVKIVPENWDNTYFHWIDNLHDWCISRQIWWGHRIPIWYHKQDPNRLICFDGDGIPEEVKRTPNDWTQEEDVLDTWFSSALWPFSTLGWPEETPDLKKFYPNSVLETGHDILFFWVARMIMMGEYAFDQPPFSEVFLHGLIYGKSYWRNKQDGGIIYVSDQERQEFDLGKPLPPDVCFRWEKMSKSKGNVIDPIEVIEEYGTDAIRMALCASATQTREIDLDRRRFEEFRNFTNKIWNGARFVLMNLEGNPEQGTTPLTAEEFTVGLDESLLSLEDHWIISALNRTVRDVNEKLSRYLFDQAALEAYDFFWKEFCSYYLEIVKPVLFGKVGSAAERKNKQKLLVIVLCQAIRLIHPMAPFITEELFQALKTRLEGVAIQSKQDPYTAETIVALQSTACMIAPYPKVIREKDINPEIDITFDLVEKVIYSIRNIRGEMKLPPGMATAVYIIGKNDDPHFQIVKNNRSIITALVKVTQLTLDNKEPTIGFASVGTVEQIKIFIPLPEQLLQQEKVRLLKEKEKLEINMQRIQTQLSNPEFMNNAPASLVDKQKQLYALAEQEHKETTEKLIALSAGGK